MEINNLQGAKAYTNTPGTTPPVRNQNSEASITDLNLENTNTAQQAFQVNITQEAQDKLADQETRNILAKTQTTTSEDQADNNITPAHEKSQIVNIVA